jgi:hypothetical protein
MIHVIKVTQSGVGDLESVYAPHALVMKVISVLYANDRVDFV